MGVSNPRITFNPDWLKAPFLIVYWIKGQLSRAMSSTLIGEVEMMEGSNESFVCSGSR
jgi:hypothetical protein